MKKCIWCLKTSDETEFNRKAHTIPQSLGGISICENVCDECNDFFGRKESGLPAIEITLKEVLNLSRYLLLFDDENKHLKKRYKSEYFNLDFQKKKIKFKHSYKFSSKFQKEFAKRFRRGLFKVFLEERERQKGDAIDSRFNFIRDFARYNKNDIPVYFQKPKFGIIVYNIDDVKNPTIRFTEYSDEIESKFSVYSYFLCGHSFIFPTSENTDILKFQIHLIIEKNPFGEDLVNISNIEDLDFRFNYMRE